ncbi:MAG: dihydrofolate reductase [Breznakia sp.]
MIILVAAIGDNFVIGKNGWMPWKLPEDLKTFKKITLHQDIVMGRTTFEAMPQPLPQRFTYVITNNREYLTDYANVKVIHDFDVLLQSYKTKGKDLYICGGAKIYEYALPYADEMWISLVDEHYEGDTFFPRFNKANFTSVSDEQKKGFRLLHYQRKKDE